MSERIMAVDPGKVCGVAFAELSMTGNAHQVWELSPFDAVALVDTYLGGRGVQALACESFTPRAGVRTWEPDALEVIGALRYVCALHNTPFLLQSPGDAKRFSTNEKLAKVGWRQPTKGGHADDAMRHLLLLAVRGGSIDPEVLL